MLLLTRRKGQSIYIGPDIEVFVARTGLFSCRLGVKAPRAVRVLRDELVERKGDPHDPEKE